MTRMIEMCKQMVQNRLKVKSQSLQPPSYVMRESYFKLEIFSMILFCYQHMLSLKKMFLKRQVRQLKVPRVTQSKSIKQIPTCVTLTILFCLLFLKPEASRYYADSLSKASY